MTSCCQPGLRSTSEGAGTGFKNDRCSGAALLPGGGARRGVLAALNGSGLNVVP